MKKYNVVVVGATGLVGRKMIQVLEERKFPVEKLRLLASAKSAGTTIVFNGKSVDVDELTKESFKGIDVALFSAGGAISKEFAPYAVKAGTLVIDNSSAFRMDPDVPLVVPEVNHEDIYWHKGIIANPNCSTIQMVVALKPIHDRWRIKRIVVSTYQGITGAGKKAVEQLEGELAKRMDVEKKFPHPIAYNVLPQIDIFVEGGYTKEEIKMVNETKKIMGDDSIKVTATCVRVPVIGGHSEAVNIELEKPFRITDVTGLLRRARGVKLQDDISKSIYPMPIWSHDKDDVFVGRIRRDETIVNGLNLWIVSDNLRKGAATNAVQIAEEWIKQLKSKK
ncbi:MAG: aspartate-semialdehyde dehydrogenase [Ignavibacteriales bacterium]|nr:aspartate-semialdehyde dehydrogenase [Ignavibacteriales bacterium]